MRIRNSASDPLDFCASCAPSMEVALKRYGGCPSDGPDGRGDCFCYDDEHPPYDHEYRCVACRAVLTEDD